MSNCGCAGFVGEGSATADGRDTDRTDFTELDRSNAEGLAGVDVPSAVLAADALVGDSSRLDTGRGRPVVVLLVETSSSPCNLTRFAGASFSLSELGRMLLKGLVEPRRPVTGGGMRVEGLFPAVLGLCGSSRSALELLRFKDWAVGLAKLGFAR